MKVKYLSVQIDEIENEKITFCDMINNLYGYILLFDPFILNIFKSIPENKKFSEVSDMNNTDLCIDLLSERINRPIKYNSKRLILMQPKEEIYHKLNSLKDIKLAGETISLCEDFYIPGISTRIRSYPQKLNFQNIAGVKNGEIYAKVGEWPALFIKDNIAVFTIDIASLFVKYLNEDKYNWLEEVSILWVLIVYKLFGKDFNVETINLFKKFNDIRRDFHSFGFAFVQLNELAKLECKNYEKEFKYASDKAIDASYDVVNNEEKEAIEKLKKAFEILKNIREKLAPIDIYLIDSLHGSPLYDDIGFAELDWPQTTADLLKKYFYLIKTRKYKMCLDLDIRTIESMSKRFPNLINEISKCCKNGTIEIINGSFTQHYPHFCSVETNIHELFHGKQVLESILKVPLVSYGGQEFCVNPAMPQILNKSGYKYAINRIQNFGYAPIVIDKIIMWTGKDDSIIPAIPSHPVSSEKKGGIFYLNLGILLHKTLKEKLSYAIFVNFQDISMIAFREETARVNYYANVFGSHITVRDYFRDVKLNELKKYKFTFNDHQQGIFYLNPEHRGNEKDALILANMVENNLIAAEFLNGIMTFKNNEKISKDLNKYWVLIEALMGHDVVIAANMSAGSFCRAVINDYRGPIEKITAFQRAKVGFEKILRKINMECCKSMQTLNKIDRQKSNKKGILIFNQLSIPRDVVIEIKPKKYELVSIPACGYRIIKKYNIAQGNDVKIIDNKIENEHIIVVIDKKTGAIKNLKLKKAGFEFIKGFANEFVYGSNSQMLCDDIFMIENKVKGMMQIIGKIVESNEIIGLYKTKISLTSGSRIIEFNTNLKPIKKIYGNPFTNSFRAKFQLAFSNPEIFRCYLNVTESIKDSFYQKMVEKLRPKPFKIYYDPEEPEIKSYNSLYYTRFAESNYSFDHYNTGTQFYLLKGTTLENILIAENEGIEEFKYAVGINEPNGFVSSLKWQSPVFYTEVSLPKDYDIWSFLTIDNSSVILSSCIYKGNGIFRLRLLETTGIKANTKITFAYFVECAKEVDYLGNSIKNLFSSGNLIELEILEYGIVDIYVKLLKK